MPVSLSSLLPALTGVLADPLTRGDGDQLLLRSVAIFDALDPPDSGAETVLLGVGVTAQEAITLLESPGPKPAVLVLRRAENEPGQMDAVVLAAARNGVTLVTVRSGIGWTEVHTALAAELEQDPRDRSGDGPVSGDLFAVADYVAELLESPVVIEDPDYQVLAFSTGQDESDTGRAATILSRRVPKELTEELRRSGVVQKLLAEAGPVLIPASGLINRDHFAIAVRAGGQLLGFLSTTLTDAPTETTRRAMVEGSKLVALALLRRHSLGEAEQLRRAEMLAAVLTGAGHRGKEAAGELGLPKGGYRVVAFEPRDPDPTRSIELGRARDVLQLQISAFHVPATCALIGRTTYVVIGGVEPGAGRTFASRLAERYQTRPGTNPEMLIGVGSHANDLAALPQSKTAALELLSLLRTGQGTLAVAEDERTRLWLRRVCSVLPDEPVALPGRFARLSASDREHGTDYIATLRAYLDAMGDVAAAAARLGVHTNTVRYRLPRLEAAAGMSLADPDARLELCLQLRAQDLDMR